MKKLAIIGHINISCHLAHEKLVSIAKNNLKIIHAESVKKQKKESIRISEVPKLEYYELTKEQIMQLPQKIKHRKKRKFHN